MAFRENNRQCGQNRKKTCIEIDKKAKKRVKYK